MAPVDISPAQNATGHFELLCSLRATNEVPVHKYKSLKTGITVVIAEVEGPAVSGYFCLVTEAHDDDGLPHTLEHLIFLGSEDYPYKGVLDLLANRCLASGTNAWTDTDHTAYTIKTAGSEGFLALLPIYLDHILFPTLTDSGFITEVHHVTKEGRDAGVVYSEMEGSENSGDSKVHRTLLRAAYPGRCGYKSLTGGAMKNLRESTTNQKVRDYHKTFYRPENLTLIISGQITPEEVFKAMEKFEEKVASKGPRGPFTRPWQEPCPPLTESVVTEVLFPSDKEDNGMVYVGWRGPSTVKEYEKFIALIVFLKYLSDTSVSPLQKNFVDIEDPLASEVNYSPIENSDPLLILQFENVPLSKIQEIESKLKTVLSNIANETEPIDMERIATVIHRKRLDCLSSLDSSPHESVAFMIIGDMLYGNTKQDMELRLNEVKLLDKLKKEDVNFWRNLMKTYLVDAPKVTVKGIPSKKEQKRLEEEDSARVAKRVEALGDDGLAQKDKQLMDAIDANERPPPPEMLISIPIPKLDSVHYHPIKRYTTDSIEQHPKFDARLAPVHMQVDHIHSNFVYMFVLMDSSQLTKLERLYLPLLFELLLESPIQRDGNTIPYEQVISQLERDTAEASTHLGFDSYSRFECGPYCQTLFLKIQVEREKYERGIVWLRELLFQTVVTEDRIKIVATKLVNEVSQVKRKGNIIVKELMKGILYHEDSNHYAVSLIRQQNFLNELLASLSKPQEVSRIISEMTTILKKITNPDNIVVHLSCNLDQLASEVDNPSALWSQLLPAGVTSAKNKLKSVTDHELMKSHSDEDDLSCIAGVGAVKSAFYCQTTPAVKDFLDDDLAPLLVFLQYLTQLEGPMWKKVRGQGLAYSYNMIPRPNEGLLYLTFYCATDIVGSFKEALIILKETLGDGDNWDKTLFESAKSSLLYEIIEREKTVADIIIQSLLSYFRNVSYEYNRNLVKQISAVDIRDLKEIGYKYVSSLVELKKSKVTIVADPAKLRDIAEAFSGFGKKLHVFDTIEESFLNK